MRLWPRSGFAPMVWGDMPREPWPARIRGSTASWWWQAHPPVQRYVVLSRVEDRVIVEAPQAVGKPKAKEKSGSANGIKPYDLSTNEFVDVIHPQGYRNVSSFEIQRKIPDRCATGGLIPEKSITLVHGRMR